MLEAKRVEREKWSGDEKDGVRRSHLRSCRTKETGSKLLNQLTVASVSAFLGRLPVLPLNIRLHLMKVDRKFTCCTLLFIFFFPLLLAVACSCGDFSCTFLQGTTMEKAVMEVASLAKMTFECRVCFKFKDTHCSEALLLQWIKNKALVHI